jgi:hypothetical protein
MPISMRAMEPSSTARAASSTAARPDRPATCGTDILQHGGGQVVDTRAELTATVEEIKSTFRAAENFGRLRHQVSSVVIELTDTDGAKANSYFLALSGARPDHRGGYRDELTRVGQDWLFAPCRDGRGSGRHQLGSL